MKRLLGMIAVLSGVLTIWLAAGCTDDDEITPGRTPPASPAVTRVEVIISDTAHFLSGDSIVTTASILVFDQTDLPMPGQKVHVWVTDTANAIIEFADAQLQDTTNAEGRVDVWYRRVCDWPDTIVAAADSIIGSAPVPGYRYDHWEPYLFIYAPQDTIFRWEQDSIMVILSLRENGPVVGALLDISTNGGIIDSLPPTDDYGYSTTYWHPTDIGQYWIAASYRWEERCHDVLLSDTFWVAVLLPRVGQVRIFATDTLFIIPGDSAAASLRVVVTTTDGHGLSGKRVSVSLDNPQIGFLEFADPTLQDTTDAFGRVHLLYTTFQPGIQTIFAVCEGVMDVHDIVTLYGP